MDNVFIKWLSLNLLVLNFMVPIIAFSQFSTKVSITDVRTPELKRTMEKNASLLLTEFNQAFAENRKPKLNKSIITEDGIRSVLSLWETTMFRCYETDLIERCLGRPQGGYEIRNVPLFIKEAIENQNYEEAVLIFTANGMIDNLYVAIEQNRYKQIIAQGKSVTELRRRQIILDFLENFRTSYIRKDMDFLNQV